MKILNKFMIATFIAAPVCASAQSNDAQAAGNSGISSVGVASSSVQTPPGYTAPDDSVIGLGPIYKNP